MKKLVSIIIAVIMCVTLVTACKKDSADNALDTVIATVDGMEITQGYYNLVYNFTYLDTYEYLHEQATTYMQNGEESWLDVKLDEERTIGDYIKENTYGQIEQLAATVSLAKEYGIEIDDSVKKEAEEQKKEIVKNYGGEEDFNKFIEDSRSNHAAVDFYLQVYVIYNRYFNEITKEGGEAYVDEETVKAAFEKEYAGKLKVQHILVSTQGEVDEKGNTIGGRSDADALAIVDEVLGKLQGGADFDSLITEYDEDPGMESGKYYVFGDGEMVEEFETASKNLKIGEYTKKGVKTSYGYHIIKRYALDETSQEYADFKNSYTGDKVLDIILEKVEKAEKTWNKEENNSYIDSWNKDRGYEI